MLKNVALNGSATAPVTRPFGRHMKVCLQDFLNDIKFNRAKYIQNR